MISPTILYSIWALLPLLYFILALWGKLEQMSKSVSKQNPEDFSRQAIFLLCCVGVGILADKFLLPSLAGMLPSFIPFGFLQVILLPIILLIGSMLIGGKEPPKIQRPGMQRKNANRRNR